MISQSIRAAIAATAFAATAVSALPSAQAASFDGPWSVVVVTKSGPCDQSYRYGVMIRGGFVSYLGGGAVSVSGRVNPAGHVSVNVSSGGQSALGSGRLSNGRGGGTWRGQGPQGTCSGTWSASQG
ncbi:MAG TPA: hypothetical protein VKD43_07405 [Xanthobacteraceae bacterium]|nr:hypothetical protein [Xanthobacteraceae bacterium]